MRMITLTPRAEREQHVFRQLLACMSRPGSLGRVHVQGDPVVALLEALAVIGLFLGAFLIYRRVMRVIAQIEERQVAPVTARLKAILDDVQDVTSTIRGQAEQVERLIRWVIRSSSGAQNQEREK